MASFATIRAVIQLADYARHPEEADNRSASLNTILVFRYILCHLRLSLVIMRSRWILARQTETAVAFAYATDCCFGDFLTYFIFTSTQTEKGFSTAGGPVVDQA